MQYSFGLFLTALVDEFGWSRAGISGVFSLYAGAYALIGLVAGRLTDRWGPRRVVTLGGLALGTGLALSGTVRALAPLYLTYLLAAAGMSTAYVPCNATVARWFAARRGVAVGLAMGGASAGIFAVPPAVALLLRHTGWRLGYLTVGIALAVLLALLARLLVRDPAARGLAPYGAGTALAARRVNGSGADWPPARATRHPSFAALLFVYTCTWIPVFLPLVHLVPLARDLGLGTAAGASALSAVGVGSLLGRVGLGLLSDVIGRRAALGLALGLEVLGFVGLAAARGAPGLLAAAAVFGFAYGAIATLMPALVTDFYGPAHAGSLVGLVFGIAGPPGALGPLLGGVVFDALGGYTWAFLTSAALNALALGGLLFARPPGPLPGRDRTHRDSLI